MNQKEFIVLVDVLKSLPSIGTKQAEKIAYFLLLQDKFYINKFVHTIVDSHQKIKFCKQCNNFSYDELCSICTNKLRNNKKLCIVNNINELNKIEQTHAFNGLFFVLNDEINVKNKTNLNNHTINKLVVLCLNKRFDEVIIATNFNINGEATNIFISKLISKTIPDAKIYRLAVGLPVNSSLDYADEITLALALKNKVKI